MRIKNQRYWEVIAKRRDNQIAHEDIYVHCFYSVAYLYINDVPPSPKRVRDQEANHDQIDFQFLTSKVKSVVEYF